MWDRDLGDVDAVIQRALAEDLATTDITAMATVPPSLRARAVLRAKAPLVVCGLAVGRRVFEQLDPTVSFEVLAAEGQQVERGAVVARIESNAQAMLGAERTALNLMQRMSGTATLTRRFVEAALGRCRITDTRKTTPGLRALERYAVRCGGGHNHRNDLGSGVLIKENHIRCAGGVQAAIVAARQRVPHLCRIACEVTTLAELDEALAAKAEVVLLDNMDDDQVRQSVVRANGRAIVEVSGGITLERVERLAAIGVDVISVGALTHSAPAADLSLLVEIDVGAATGDRDGEDR